MKTIIIAFVAASALASSALARAPTHTRADAQQMHGARAQALATGGADAVYANGTYLGADPDPQVRLQLMRNAGFQDR
jgi:hypothetical protein